MGLLELENRELLERMQKAYRKLALRVALLELNGGGGGGATEVAKVNTQAQATALAIGSAFKFIKVAEGNKLLFYDPDFGLNEVTLISVPS